MTKLYGLVSLALLCVLVATPGFAVEAAAPVAPVTAITIPYGNWIGTYGLELAGYAVTALAGLVAAAVARFWPIAASILTQKRLETAGRAIAEYAINAVAGSTKDGKVTINMGSTVVAAAVQRGIDAVPSWVVKAAGGPVGLAAVVFRVLPLEEGANKANVLDPAVAKLKQTGIA